VKRVERFDAASWDEALGKPHEAKKLHAHRQRRRQEFDVWIRVHQLRACKPKPKDIFRAVGEEFKISAATAKRYFDGIEGRMPQRFRKTPK